MHWIDPESLPATNGTLRSFVLNHHGDLDGMVIAPKKGAAKLVHFPPHMGTGVVKAFAVGDAVEVRGVKPRGSDMIAAVALRTAKGKEILDHGPEVQGPPKPLKAKDVAGDIAGTVLVSLYGPKGELRGAVLEDGTALRIGPKEARAFAKLLTPGAMVAGAGHGLETKYGTAYHLDTIGPDAKHQRSVKPKKKS